MGGISQCWFLVLLVCLQCPFLIAQTHQLYIIRTTEPQERSVITSVGDWHMSIMASALSSQPEKESYKTRIVHNYEHVFHGFAATLTAGEAVKIGDSSHVLGLYKAELYQLHTTRSPAFLGLLERSNGGVAASPEESWAGSDVIVGMVDSGVWPESPSFNDRGMAEIPERWKGKCESGEKFSRNNCNRKLIGARVFYQGYLALNGSINKGEDFKSARDADGHGTHTASTVAGALVAGANFLGYANGTARGVAPGARLAAYKVCWSGGCANADVLAAIDQAVADGVDILSMSIGQKAGKLDRYDKDPLSIASFAAMEKGVLVSSSAGNDGPDAGTVVNVSPWVTTVAASTMDREFPAKVTLGNNLNFTGVSLYSGKSRRTGGYPLAYFAGRFPSNASLCLNGSLDRRQAAGKIVICDAGTSVRVEKGQVVKDAGGVGMVVANSKLQGESLSVAEPHVLPALSVGFKEGEAMKKYSASKNNHKPTASLSFMGTLISRRAVPSPVLARFSSRGPNSFSPEILKPDLTAPGVNILAAWSGNSSPSELPEDKRRVKYNIISGTSMSCPHVSGMAALLKARHPKWSPAAIKSALMTTAYVHSRALPSTLIKDGSTNLSADAYAYGAGHVDGKRLMMNHSPGLVYDASPQDYFDFLCTQKLNPKQLKLFSSDRNCSSPLRPATDLNYPSISVVFPNSSSNNLTVHRTVTNVGSSNSIYRVAVSKNFRLASVEVSPKTLKFTSENQKLSYEVIIAKKNQPSSKVDTEFGHLIWEDGNHTVRSPVVIAY